MKYKAKNIDVDKFLARLEVMERDALFRHLENVNIEQARFDQERKTIDQIRDMFYCSNYEIEEKNNE